MNNSSAALAQTPDNQAGSLNAGKAKLTLVVGGKTAQQKRSWDGTRGSASWAQARTNVLVLDRIDRAQIEAWVSRPGNSFTINDSNQGLTGAPQFVDTLPPETSLPRKNSDYTETEYWAKLAQAPAPRERNEILLSLTNLKWWVEVVREHCLESVRGHQRKTIKNGGAAPSAEKTIHGEWLIHVIFNLYQAAIQVHHTEVKDAPASFPPDCLAHITEEVLGYIYATTTHPSKMEGDLIRGVHIIGDMIVQYFRPVQVWAAKSNEKTIWKAPFTLQIEQFIAEIDSIAATCDARTAEHLKYTSNAQETVTQHNFMDPEILNLKSFLQSALKWLLFSRGELQGVGEKLRKAGTELSRVRVAHAGLHAPSTAPSGYSLVERVTQRMAHALYNFLNKP